MRPHILLITTDQQRGDTLSCDGHPVCETPNLDMLASKGFRFTKAYASVPSCTPSRAAMMTGMDQWNHGRLNMQGDDALEWPQTLPGGLASAGYQTQAVGKMHFYPQRRLYGFHNMVLDESGRSWDGFKSDYIEWFERNKTADIGYRDHSIDWNSWMARPSHLPEHLHPSYWTASEGIRFLQNRDITKPFFLWLSFARPHSPYDAPQPYWDMYRDADIPKPYIGDWCSEQDRPNADVNAPFSHRPWAQTRRARQGYYGNITFIDHQLGRFFYEMERIAPGTLDNTLVVFTSDHGDMMGDHHHWRKTYAFEGSSRVPFLVRPPKKWGLKTNTAINNVIEMRDILPTLWEAAGVKCPSTVDGSSLLPLLKDGKAKWREYVHGEHTRCYTMEYGQQWMTDGKEKYVWFHHTGRELFFDMQNDPNELHDLSRDANAQPRILEWRNRLAKILEKRGDPRGKNGELVVVKEGLGVSPNYDRWKEAAQKIDHRREK